MSEQPNLAKFMVKVQGGKMYLSVAGRLVWFRQEHPRDGILTEIVEINTEKQYAIFRASIVSAEGTVLATATKREDVKGFGDFIEKAETGAIGRALNLCGYGTDDLDSNQIVDSPQPAQQRQNGQQQAKPSPFQGQDQRGPRPDEQPTKHPTKQPEAKPSMDEYRRRATHIHGRWDKDIQKEWNAYIQEAYGAPDIASVAGDHIYALWQEIVSAEKDARAAAEQAQQAKAPVAETNLPVVEAKEAANPQ